MLIFATSDKGGTGRSVTSCNVAYRRALQGDDVCYLDFDFGSPTAGSIFNIPSAFYGVEGNGLHSYLHGDAPEPRKIEVWSESDRSGLRGRPSGAGRLVLLPGDRGGGEFAATPDIVRQCVTLLMRLEEEFELCLIDLSAGRSYATDIVLAATADPRLRSTVSRWLVFHRWTRQHIIAAAGLVYGHRGLLETGAERGHDQEKLAEAIRFVRTAVVDPNSPDLAGLRPFQVAWLRECNQDLQAMARQYRVGRAAVLGTVPLDPVLQWREQLISNNDVYTRKIANEQTIQAFDGIAKRLTDDATWVGL
jgi:hypothetical protein